MFNILILLTTVLTPVSGQWLLVKSDTNYCVYLHENWKQNHSYKAEGLFPVPLDTLYNFLLEVDNYPKWVNYCAYADLIKSEKDKNYVYYAFYDLPWPLANRHAVTELNISWADNGSVTVTSTPSNMSFEKDSDSKLVIHYGEEFILIPHPENMVLFKMQGSYHPGGYIPSWVIKKFLSYGPYDILLNIEKELKNKK